MSGESSGSSNKVIVSCAITGAIHVPSLTPHLPITPDQIAENAIGAAEAGAAIVHLHARDPEDGRPTPDPEVFAQFLPEIGAASDVVINITTGGGHGMSLEERTAAARRFQPELCSLNMGSMNFGLFPMLDRIGDTQHEWERDYLEMTRDFIFKNTFKDFESIVWREPLRVRVLRHRPPLQLGLSPREGDRRAAAVRAVGLRHPGRHRDPPGGRAAHEADR
jgi:3,5-dioxohexanoate:acetyl-CoA acetone transferase